MGQGPVIRRWIKQAGPLGLHRDGRHCSPKNEKLLEDLKQKNNMLGWRWHPRIMVIQHELWAGETEDQWQDQDESYWSSTRRWDVGCSVEETPGKNWRAMMVEDLLCQSLAGMARWIRKREVLTLTLGVSAAGHPKGEGHSWEQSRAGEGQKIRVPLGTR